MCNINYVCCIYYLWCDDHNYIKNFIFYCTALWAYLDIALYKYYYIIDQQGSTIALARRVFWGCRASSGHQFSYFTGPTGHWFQQVTMELFTIVLDSFHQLSLIMQHLNIICDSLDSRYQSKLVTILFTNCRFSITSPGVATGDARRRGKTDNP